MCHAFTCVAHVCMHECTCVHVYEHTVYTKRALCACGIYALHVIGLVPAHVQVFTAGALLSGFPLLFVVCGMLMCVYLYM